MAHPMRFFKDDNKREEKPPFTPGGRPVQAEDFMIKNALDSFNPEKKDVATDQIEPKCLSILAG